MLSNTLCRGSFRTPMVGGAAFKGNTEENNGKIVTLLELIFSKGFKTDPLTAGLHCNTMPFVQRDQFPVQDL